MCALQDSDRVGTNTEAAPRRMLRDDDDVRKLLTIITLGLMTDPFSLDEEDDDISPLIKIATDIRMPFALTERLVSSLRLALLGQITKVCGTETDYQQHNVLGFPPKSEDQDICFTGQEENGETGLWDKVVVINADRELFGRLVIAAKSRVINLKMSSDKRYQQSPSP